MSIARTIFIALFALWASLGFTKTADNLILFGTGISEFNSAFFVAEHSFMHLLIPPLRIFSPKIAQLRAAVS